MKSNCAAAFVVSLAALSGCAQEPGPVAPISTGESWTAVFDSAVNNAIISQQTLFPYHFKPDAADLNELGEKDLAVLMAHYRNHPAELRVRRGDAADGLYGQRVQAVVERLDLAGLRMDRIPIADSVAGGSGLGNEQVLVNLERRNTPPACSEQSSGSFGATLGLSGGSR